MDVFVFLLGFEAGLLFALAMGHRSERMGLRFDGTPKEEANGLD